jgi:hypothetical protein
MICAVSERFIGTYISDLDRWFDWAVTKGSVFAAKGAIIAKPRAKEAAVRSRQLDRREIFFASVPA